LLDARRRHQIETKHARKFLIVTRSIALNNVAKHSGATRVALVLRRSARQSGNGSGRLGLLGIQERLGMVGGNFKLESAPEQGATLLVRVPIFKPREKEKKSK